MKCKIDITAGPDHAVLVGREGFMKNVDLEDLYCCGAETSEDWYHTDWFRIDDFGELYFTPPAFEFRNGKISGINGRHRTVVLFRHQRIIPMLIVKPAVWPLSTLEDLIQGLIWEDQIVELPDLAINCEAPSELEWPNRPLSQKTIPRVDLSINIGHHKVTNVTPKKKREASSVKINSDLAPVSETGKSESAAADNARGTDKPRGKHNG